MADKKDPHQEMLEEAAKRAFPGHSSSEKKPEETSSPIPPKKNLSQRISEEFRAELGRTARKALYERGGFIGRVMASATGEGYYLRGQSTSQTSSTGSHARQASQKVTEKIDQNNRMIMASVDRLNQAVARGTASVSRQFSSMGAKVDSSIKKAVEIIKRIDPPAESRKRAGIEAVANATNRGRYGFGALAAGAGILGATAAYGALPKNGGVTRDDENAAPKDDVENKKREQLQNSPPPPRAGFQTKELIFKAREVEFEAKDFKWKTKGGRLTFGGGSGDEVSPGTTPGAGSGGSGGSRRSRRRGRTGGPGGSGQRTGGAGVNHSSVSGSGLNAIPPGEPTPEAWRRGGIQGGTGEASGASSGGLSTAGPSMDDTGGAGGGSSSGGGGSPGGGNRPATGTGGGSGGGRFGSTPPGMPQAGGADQSGVGLQSQSSPAFNRVKQAALSQGVTDANGIDMPRDYRGDPVKGAMPSRNTSTVQGRQLSLYDSSKVNTEWTDTARRALVAEIGRENDYRPGLLYGSHTDPYNRVQNSGIISWQKERRHALNRHMQAAGFMNPDGSFQNSAEAERAQMEFIDKEMKQNYPKSYAAMRDPNMSYRDLTRVLGKDYIRWRHDDPVYASHHGRRDRHFQSLNDAIAKRGDVGMGGDWKPPQQGVQEGGWPGTPGEGDNGGSGGETNKGRVDVKPWNQRSGGDYFSKDSIMEKGANPPAIGPKPGWNEDPGDFKLPSNEQKNIGPVTSDEFSGAKRKTGQVKQGTGSELTAYSPQVGGDKMEGGYASSRPGIGNDGYTVKTLADYAAGRSNYVTMSGDPSQYGKKFTIPEMRYQGLNPDDNRYLADPQTIKNVPGYVHDTGSAFKGKGQSKFDIPVARDMVTNQLNMQPFSQQVLGLQPGWVDQKVMSGSELRSSSQEVDAMSQQNSVDPAPSKGQSEEGRDGIGVHNDSDVPNTHMDDHFMNDFAGLNNKNKGGGGGSIETGND